MTELAVGGNHNCARKSDGTLWCWGYNKDGQLGDDSNTDRLSPVQVTTLGSAVTHVGLGHFHSCAIKTDGTLWCWGNNLNGSLGLGSTGGGGVERPFQVDDLSGTVAQVALGYSHTCARLTDGSVWCWGTGASGQLGDGSMTLTGTPVQVSDLGSDAAQIALGDYHSCAHTVDGRLHCWGGNGHGSLGTGVGGNAATPQKVVSCGDGVCDFAERRQGSCSEDCTPVADDGVCDPFLDCTKATHAYCDPDCPDPTPATLVSLCGNGRCDMAAGETGANCGHDCDVTCVADCSGKTCGNDGCGGSCGSCSGTEACNPTGQCEETMLREAGKVSTNHVWKTVTLQHTYADPVVIIGAIGYAGNHASTVRVRNVTTSSFEVQVDEWDYHDGGHATETMGYMVLEAGTHTLSDGTKVVAGTTSLGKSLKTVSFGSAFGAAPVVFSTVVTVNDAAAVNTRQKNVGTASFQLMLEEQELDKATAHANETAAWVAIEKGTGSSNGKKFEALVTPNAVTHADYVVSLSQSFSATPAFFAKQQTLDGGDTAVVRYKSLSGSQATIFVEEEASKDTEISHTTEAIGCFAIDTGSF